MFHTIKETFTDLLFFVKNPKALQDDDQTTSLKLKRLFSILAIDLPITAILATLIFGLEELGFVDTDNHMMNDLIESTPVIVILFLTVIIVPFIEELIFRLFLKWERNYLLQLFIAIFPKTKETLFRFWRTYFGYVFYFSVIVFGFVHITNYEMGTIPLWTIPILVLPQLFAGIIIGYLRVRYNFMYGFFMHALHNAIFISMALLGMDSLNDKDVQITNDSFTLSIESAPTEKNSLIKYTTGDTIQFKAVGLKEIISTLNKKEVAAIETNNTKSLNEKLNLIFVNTSGREINKDSLLLDELKRIYQFDIENLNREEKIHQLYVKDSLLLNTFLSKEGESSSTIVTTNEIEFKHAGFHEIAKAFTKQYDLFVEVDSSLMLNSTKKFNLVFKREDFPKLKNQLITDYGVGINETEKELNFILVKF